MRKWLAGALTAVSLVVLAVTFSPAATGITLTGFFVDDDGHLFEADIDAIAEAGITKGCNPPTNNRYCPDDDVTRGEMAAFLRRALGLPQTSTDFFSDDNDSIFEEDINAIAAARITRGCNPPANDRYCPDDDVDRGQMAAFLRRALGLTSSTVDHFADDDSSIFEQDINAIADEGVTKGCNPPSNTSYCPNSDVSRGEMAAFLRRARNLPAVVQRIPIGSHNAMRCSKDGERCSLTVDVSAGKRYEVKEGVFQVEPATAAEESAFNASNTSFNLTLNGRSQDLNELPQESDGNIIARNWRRSITFAEGDHTLVGRWRWNGVVLQTNTIIIRASG